MFVDLTAHWGVDASKAIKEDIFNIKILQWHFWSNWYGKKTIIVGSV